MTGECAEEKNENPTKLRRSSRLNDIVKKIGIKERGVINIEEEETPKKIPVDRSPLHQYEADPNRGTPNIDPAQQRIYDYVESLEGKALEEQEISLSPQEPPIETMRRDNYEFKILNRHIKNENEILREQVKLKNDMNNTLTLQMRALYKASMKLKKKVIN